MKFLIKKTVRIFSSTYTTVVLLILLAVASVPGTVILQEPVYDAESIRQVYSEEVFKWLNRFGLLDVYHSPLFIALVLALTLNLSVCTVRAGKSVAKRLAEPGEITADDQISRQRFFCSLSPEDPGLAFDSIKALLSEKRVKLTEYNDPVAQRRALLGEKARYSAYAFYLVHLGFLIILLGAVISGITGVSGSFRLPVGEKTDIFFMKNGVPRKFGFTVHCDSFEIEKYAGDSVKQYKSELRITKDGNTLKKALIKVNQPLDYEGFRFFQAEYGIKFKDFILTAVKSESGEEILREEMREGEEFSLQTSDGALSIYVVKLFSHLVVGDDRAFINQSEEFENPAAHLLIQNGEAVETWVFEKHDFHGDVLPRIKFGLDTSNAESIYFTGIQVSKNPGVWIVWGGCFTLIAGLVIFFAVPHIRLWLIQTPGSVMFSAKSGRRSHSAETFYVNFKSELKSVLQDQPRKRA